MHQELVALQIPIEHKDNIKETVNDMLVAPSYVVRAFAEFLADREDDDTFSIKGVPVKFQDCTVSVGDSNKVVAAYECLKRYDIPLGNFEIFKELIKQSSACSWRLDQNYRLFEKWFVSRKKDDDDDEATETDY